MTTNAELLRICNDIDDIATDADLMSAAKIREQLRSASTALRAHLTQADEITELERENERLQGKADRLDKLASIYDVDGMLSEIAEIQEHHEP